MGIEEAKQKMQNQNPSAAPGKTIAERKRIPLSVPQRKLEVPDMPGYHCRWFRGTASRLAQAERAGFIYVEENEVELNSVSLGGDASKAGNTDLGSRVSVVEGSETENGQAVRMYLMKQPIEFKKEDDAILETRNDGIAKALSHQFATGAPSRQAGAPSENDADMAARYVPKGAKVPKLFQKKRSAG